MEIVLSYLVGAGAVISVLIEILKKTSFPTEKPKLVATLIAVMVVIVAYLVKGEFVLEQVDVMVASIVAVVGFAVAFYEFVIKPFVVKKLP